MASSFQSSLNGKRLSHVLKNRTEVDQSSALLQLPREIRYQIFEYVMQYTSSPPQGAQVYSRWIRITDRITIDSVRSDLSLKHDIKDAFPRLPRTKYLFLICRQIRRELRYLTKKSTDRRPQASLDVLVSGYRFYPTWTSIPVLCNARQGIDVTVVLRIMSGEAFWAHAQLPPRSSLPPGLTLVMILLTALQEHLRAMRDREAIILHDPPLLLRQATFELHCRDQYTSGGFNMLQAALTSKLTRMMQPKSTVALFEHFVVKSIDPVTGVVTETSASSEPQQVAA